LTRDSTTGAVGAPDASTQCVTLSIPTHMAAPSHALVLREGPKPTRPRGRIPRVARLLALAHHCNRVGDPAAAIQRAVALFDPVWDLLLVPERFRILHLLSRP
jgi:hypothetical protein